MIAGAVGLFGGPWLGGAGIAHLGVARDVVPLRRPLAARRCAEISVAADLARVVGAAAGFERRAVLGLFCRFRGGVLRHVGSFQRKLMSCPAVKQNRGHESLPPADFLLRCPRCRSATSFFPSPSHSFSAAPPSPSRKSPRSGSSPTPTGKGPSSRRASNILR